MAKKGRLTPELTQGVVEWKLRVAGIDHIDPHAEEHLCQALLMGRWGSVYWQQLTLTQYMEVYKKLPVFAEMQVRSIMQYKTMGPYEFFVQTLGDLERPVILQTLIFQKLLEEPPRYFASLRRPPKEARIPLCVWDVENQRLPFHTLPRYVARLS